MNKKITKKKKVKPVKSKDVPATKGMLYSVRDQLVNRMDAKFQKVESQIHGLRSEIHGVKSEVHGLKSEVHGIKSQIHGLKSDIHELKSELHRVALLVEEQNARNIFVLDGLTSLFERQDRVEETLTRKLG